MTTTEQLAALNAHQEALLAQRQGERPIPAGVTWPRRVALTVHVVLELDDWCDYFAEEPTEPTNDDEVRVQIEADFAGFVANEVTNTTEYGASIIAIDATVTEVSQ